VFIAISGAIRLGPDTEKYDADYYCCWKLIEAVNNTVSDHGVAIPKGTKYYQRYLVFRTITGINKVVETRQLTEKEYFLWKLQGKEIDIGNSMNIDKQERT
jgi:hypothetical protein